MCITNCMSWQETCCWKPLGKAQHQAKTPAGVANIICIVAVVGSSAVVVSATSSFVSTTSADLNPRQTKPVNDSETYLSRMLWLRTGTRLLFTDDLYREVILDERAAKLVRRGLVQRGHCCAVSLHNTRSDWPVVVSEQ
jgi:hypothetical protein